MVANSVHSRRIADRFEIRDPEKDLLGRGGMGEVYRATDAHTGELVAVKALDPGVVARDPGILERFVREGEALRQLDHPNIVRMIAAVEDEDRHYLVMEYVAGGSLHDLLDTTRPDRSARPVRSLSVPRVLEIALDLADALTRAHRLGIIHRDLKPANVLLAEDGTPRLTDFGIAYMADTPRLTQTGILMGTVDYLSPEACEGEPIDERGDIWSFGVMLYEMLSGERPFGGKSLSATLTAILTQPLPDLAQRCPDAPEALVDLVYRMLEKDRRQRIPSVRLVGAELEAILKGREMPTPLRLAPGESRFAEEGRFSGESRFSTPTPDATRPRHNLPAQPTPFVGREAELTELARLLADPDVRLLTILGGGGMGKTRLALEAGAAQLNNFQHGVYFVSLAPLQSAEAIVPTVAGALGFSFYEGGKPRQQLLDYLREKNKLLIMDNFEHLLASPEPGRGDGAGLVADVLQAAPAVKVLTTSRARLNVQGETLFRLAGMDFPEPLPQAEAETPEDAADYSAVKLFLQSARRVQPGFELATDDLKYVVRICWLVGGMPLGILLAAAWLTMLTPAEIADQISGEIEASLDFLETDLRDVPERQRSLRAVFDYSWNLLGERERAVFAGLSVFRGGFVREVAQAVTSATLRELRVLVDKSLLYRNPIGRYEVHELLRQYGLDKLVQLGELETLRQRHLEAYLSLAGQGEAPGGQQEEDWLHHLADETDNLRAALDWCLRSGSAQSGLRLALQLISLWGTYGHWSERRDWLTRLLAMAPEPTLERARGLEALGHTAYSLGDYAQALALCEESLALSESLGDLPAIADATFRLAWPAFALGDRARSYALLERSMHLYQQLDNRDREAFVVLVLGELMRAEGDLERARELHEQSVALHREPVGKAILPTALYNLACVLIHFGELDRSQELLRESISIELERGGNPDYHLMGFSFLANARGQPLRAVRVLAASDALRVAIGEHVDVGDRLDYEHALASLRAQLGDAAFEAAWAEGEALTREQVVALALNEQAEGAGASVADPG
jgi:serine/threonine protein kinase/tetratricopeptide (TPR) repeat protein